MPDENPTQVMTENDLIIDKLLHCDTSGMKSIDQIPQYIESVYKEWMDSGFTHNITDFLYRWLLELIKRNIYSTGEGEYYHRYGENGGFISGFELVRDERYPYGWAVVYNPYRLVIGEGGGVGEEKSFWAHAYSWGSGKSMDYREELLEVLNLTTGTGISVLQNRILHPGRYLDEFYAKFFPTYNLTGGEIARHIRMNAAYDNNVKLQHGFF